MFKARPLAGVHNQQVPAAGGTEYSIWGSSTLGTASPDSEISIVLGTKFRASSNGYIVGIRWQNISGWAQVGDVALFSGTTNISGTRTVTGQTASGWQRMDFASPVAITASTIYMAAARYTNANFSYRATDSYFASAGVTNGPLEAVANSVSTNGMYIYNGTMVAPNSTWQSSCYFIDVVYTS